jgi:hypothetical protein
MANPDISFLDKINFIMVICLKINVLALGHFHDMVFDVEGFIIFVRKMAPQIIIPDQKHLIFSRHIIDIIV